MKRSQLKENVLYVLILFFLSALYLPVLYLPWLTIINIVAVALLIGYTLWFSSGKEKWRTLKERKHLHSMFLFFIVVLISVLLSVNFNKGLRYLDPRLPLLFFPASVGLLQLTKSFRNKVLLGFAYITTAVCVLCLCHSVYQSGFFKKPEFLYNDSLTGLIGQQSIYTSLLVNISIYTFVYFILFNKSSHRFLMIVCTFFLFGISYLLASRMMMAILYAISISFCFYYIVQKRKIILGACLFLILLTGIGAALQFFPQTFNRFKELTYVKFNYQSMEKESHYNMDLTENQWNGANFRIAAWKCGWKLFKQSPILGVHIGDKKDKLIEAYKQENFQFAIKSDKNVHNNYLDILYSMGIIGLGSFMLGWLILPIIAAWKYKDGLAILIIITFASAWITEIYFDRSLGGMLTGFFIPFLLTYINYKKQP